MTKLCLKYLIWPLWAIGFIACHSNEYSPKPRAYHRLYFPEKEQQSYEGDCPFRFQYPIYSHVHPDTLASGNSCWMDIDFEHFNASLHLSYYSIGSPALLDELSEDAHTFAFKHAIKASYIDEAMISYPERKVYGTFYTIGGNAASPAQFYVTDSTRHYLRASLYFNERPKIDSLQPVVDYIMEDMRTMIKTLEWK